MINFSGESTRNGFRSRHGQCGIGVTPLRQDQHREPRVSYSCVVKAPRFLVGIAMMALLAGLDLTVAPIAQACACGGFIASDGERVTANKEYAALSWDGHSERMILSMNTRSVSKEAALLIPTPSPAKAALAEASAFAELRKATAPVTETDYRWWPDWSHGNGAAGAPVGSAEGDVSVLRTSRLGPLEVSTLAATDADKLTGWLNQHHYVMRDSMADALKPYIADGWYYTAIRLVSEEKVLSGTLQPVDLTFDSEEFVYPMRLSSAATDPQFVRTYVFADHQVVRSDETAEHGSPSTYFAGTVPDGALTARSLTELRAQHPYLTVIDQTFHHPERQIMSDFTFARAESDQPYRRVIHRTEMRTIAGVPAGPVLVVLGAFLVAAGTVSVLAVRRRHRSSRV